MAKKDPALKANNEFDDLKLELQGYSVYFNEYRPHSSLNGVTPSEALENVTN